MGIKELLSCWLIFGFVDILVVVDIEVMMVSDSSVRVSWDIDYTNITGYTVYGYAVFYSLSGNQNEEDGMAIGNINSVLIDHLISGMEYQFQVAVLAEIDRVIVSGERSQATRIVVSAPADVNDDQTQRFVIVVVTSGVLVLVFVLVFYLERQVMHGKVLTSSSCKVCKHQCSHLVMLYQTEFQLLQSEI